MVFYIILWFCLNLISSYLYKHIDMVQLLYLPSKSLFISQFQFLVFLEVYLEKMFCWRLKIQFCYFSHVLTFFL